MQAKLIVPADGTFERSAHDYNQRLVVRALRA
jgi:hypothetical protein